MENSNTLHWHQALASSTGINLSTASKGGMHAGNRIWYIYLCYHIHLARLLQWAKKIPYSVTPLKMDMARNCQSLPNNSQYMGPFQRIFTHA